MSIVQGSNLYNTNNESKTHMVKRKEQRTFSKKQDS